ncbi:MAG TPA: hypothetical protein VGR14_05125 [Verrucomicrobiae bacterium]|jgi:hypothetical protein|nr:hypothetical protein [Verrucomicrobiae bacterium]
MILCWVLAAAIGGAALFFLQKLSRRGGHQAAIEASGQAEMNASKQNVFYDGGQTKPAEDVRKTERTVYGNSASKTSTSVNLNPDLTIKHFLAFGAVGLVVLIGYRIVQSRKTDAEHFQQQMTVQAKMPTADEAVKWAIWDAKTKYYSFDVLSTNITELREKHTYRGEKQGGAAEVEAERRQFGAAYDAWSQGDSFTRTETSYECELTITHTKPKPDSEHSILITAEMEGNLPDTNHLETTAYLLHLQEYSDYKILREEVYQVNRTVWGQLMKAVNTANGIAYVWDTEERTKTYLRPTWVIIQEVGNLKSK